MPSLLSKVQDARKFLAHYPSFLFLKVMMISILFLCTTTLGANKDNSNKDKITKSKPSPSIKLQQGPRQLRQFIDPTSEKQRIAFEKKMYNAAKLYEKQFLREMVKAMRSTVKYSKYSKPTMAERIYKDKMYEKYVTDWSKKGGVGFGEIIYKQMLEKYSPYHQRKIRASVGQAMALNKKKANSYKALPKGKKSSLPLVEREEK